MSNSSEKLAFSQRLKQQLALRNWPVNSSTWLAKEFNIRFNGSSVSVQTASNWLMGAGIPNQEKLIVLAAWLQVSPEWLRFGEPQLNSNKVESSKAIYAVGVQTQLQDLPDKIAKLSPRQKQAVYNVVEAMLEEKPKNI